MQLLPVGMAVASVALLLLLIPHCAGQIACLMTETGEEYMGKIFVTKSGLRCQHWGSETPHIHKRCRGEAARENFCSNSFGGKKGCSEKKPWCYTTNPKKRWEFCDIPMCKTGVTRRPRECLFTEQGFEYRGRVRVTKSGRKCQKWRAHWPHKHLYCLGEAAAENYCTNSFSDKKNCVKKSPWCFTEDRGKRRELCDIPMCEKFPEEPSILPAAVELYFTEMQSIPGSDCLLTEDGQEFVGAAGFTKTGRRCQYWSSHTPHTHWACPGEAASDNYCTNSFAGLPGCFRKRPWCYTTDPKKKWEYCNIPMCHSDITDSSASTVLLEGTVRECLLTPNGKEYRGHMSVTKSGRSCQKWSSQKPHKHMTCYGEAVAENYCSNSFLSKPSCYESKPWCYTTDPKKRWEECDIEMCEIPEESDEESASEESDGSG